MPNESRERVYVEFGEWCARRPPSPAREFPALPCLAVMLPRVASTLLARRAAMPACRWQRECAQRTPPPPLSPFFAEAILMPRNVASARPFYRARLHRPRNRCRVCSGDKRVLSPPVCRRALLPFARPVQQIPRPASPFSPAPGHARSPA